MSKTSLISSPKPSSIRSDPRKFDRTASFRRLIWRRFRRHRIAVASLFVIMTLYAVAIFAEFFATDDPNATNAHLSYLQPQRIRWFDDGQFRPHVLGVVGRRDPATLQRFYVLDANEKIPVRFFAQSKHYKIVGLIPCSRRLVTVDDPKRSNVYFFGTDRLGRDIWSRLLHATRVSMSVGLVGVLISLTLGTILGGLSGLKGGWIDNLIQRIIEFLRSIPTIPLWLGLAAAMPRHWSIIQVYFTVTVIISLIGWTQVAREVRGKLLSLREEEFVTAARAYGCSEMRILLRHLLPCISSHLIAVATLAIPAMIISETSLSFLGMGIRPPAISWGTMLQEAQNIQTIALYWWMMIPALVVIIAVLAFNFVGDALRDAADPTAVN